MTAENMIWCIASYPLRFAISLCPSTSRLASSPLSRSRTSGWCTGRPPFSLSCSCWRHQIWAIASISRSIFCMSDGMWNCLNTLAKQETTPVPMSRTELMYSRRSVCDKEKSSPRNSPTCVRHTEFSERKLLSSTGKSRTAPVDTRKARPWPGLLLKISTPVLCRPCTLLRSLSTGARGTKKGSKRRRDEIWISSWISFSRLNCHGRSIP
mmetsp:Transcript_86641/g.223147  ORF Transcript_86641/g.223147 Transcript_86641/m.223147 type:complete len:210 (+) Transcript_86641:1254-1883(+)